MSARVVITPRSIPVTVEVVPVEATLEEICSACLKVCPPDFIHECTLCLSCCECRACRLCGEILKLAECSACGLCRTCCHCWACRRCNCPHTHRTQLCDLCGCGKSNSCGCCTHDRPQRAVSIERFHSPINLGRYTAPTLDLRTLNPSQRLLAAEIEICGIKRDHHEVVTVLKAWSASIVHDGSLPGGGFEINTHPAAGNFFVEQINDICAALCKAKAHVTSEAGCHTHVDARDLGYLGLARLLRMVSCTEAAMFQMIPLSRRTSTFCAYWAPHYLGKIHQADTQMRSETNERKRIVAYRRAILEPLYGSVHKEKVSAVRRTKQGGQRYRATNVHSWCHRGTIEFRMPTGTIYPQNIINWGLLLGNLVDLASYRSDDEIKYLTADVEKIIRVENLYSVEYLQVPSKLIEASIVLLKGLAPSDEVRDWITERIKWASQITRFREEYQ